MDVTHTFTYLEKSVQSWIRSHHSVRFLVYAEHEKSYCFEEVSTGKIEVIRDARFKVDKLEDGVRDYKGETIITDL